MEMLKKTAFDCTLKTGTSNAGTSENPSIAERFVMQRDLSVRYLTLNDRSREARDDWMHSTFHSFKEYIFSDHGTDYLSSAAGDYDVIIIGGNDARRISKIIKQNQSIFNRKLKISLMSKSGPRRRAAVLLAGFDDVFDTAKMHPLEAAARIEAMSNRYKMREQQEREDQEDYDQINAVAYFDTLTKREKLALRVLLDRSDHFASYEFLKQNISEYHEDISFPHLKVFICLIRKKLRPGFTIKSITLQGYQLVSNNSANVEIHHGR